MNLLIEGLRTRIFGPEWAIDRIPKKAQSFEEFLSLSRQARAGRVRLQMIVRESSTRVFDLNTIISSWRGDQADMVVLKQEYDERITGLLEKEGVTTQLRLLKTVMGQVKSVKAVLPRAQTSVGLAVPGLPDVDLNPWLEELDRRPGLAPLTPRSPQTPAPSIV